MSRILTSAIIAAALMGAPALAQDVVGRNAAVKGTVTIASMGEEARAAIVKQPVRLADEVTSQLDSSLQVLLLDETVFTVGPEAQLTIDRFVYDPDRNTGGMSASVKKGMFRFMSGKTARTGPNAVSIDTPVASLGVRGTIVEGIVGQEAIDLARILGLIDPSMEIDPDGATLFVLRGPGRERDSRDRPGEIVVSSGGGSVVLTEPGQVVFIANRDAPPTRPRATLPGELDLFDLRLRTEPTGDASYQPFDVEIDRPPSKRRRPVAEPYSPEIDMDWPEEDIFGGECPC